MSGAPGAPAAPGGDRHTVTRFVVRTALLAVSIAFLFPAVLDGPTQGAWPRIVEAMGPWRWAAWAACFAAMTLMRFAGGPPRT